MRRNEAWKSIKRALGKGCDASIGGRQAPKDAKRAGPNSLLQVPRGPSQRLGGWFIEDDSTREAST